MKNQSELDTDNKSNDNSQKEEISMLINRVDNLENTVNHVTEKQANLTHKLRKYSESIDEVTDVVNSLQETVEELENDSMVHESRITSIAQSLDSIEESLQDTRGDMDTTSDKMGRRLTAIENMLDLDEVDIAQAVKPDACELEQLTTIPEESRKESFDVRVQRAIAVYQQFNDISTPVQSGGKRILSSDIKMFLNGYTNKDIAYSQVQRVIDSFDEKTGDNYETIQTSDGRAIVWHPENKN